MKPEVLSIAGFDPSGGAGLIADIETISALGGHCTGIVTATTAQSIEHFVAANPTPAALVAMQIAALYQDKQPAKSIKLGMLGSVDNVKVISDFLMTRARDCFVIIDPVLKSSSGGVLGDQDVVAAYRQHLLARADLVTPNLPEASALLGRQVRNTQEMDEAAFALLELGAKAVLVKGGHLNVERSNLRTCDDVQFIKDKCIENPAVDKQDSILGIFDPQELALDRYRDRSGRAYWLASPRLGQTARGTGCVLSAAIASGVSNGQDLLDAIVMARAYIHRALRLSSCSRLYHAPWPVSAEDFSKIAPELSDLQDKLVFPSTGAEALGFYPIVDRAAWLPRLHSISTQGRRLSTIQLRIKDLTGAALEQEVATAVSYAKQHQIRLFINDHWQLAMCMQAYGVHLGQEDLETADLRAIAAAGLRLGLSTHSYAELARAKAVGPSYIALGPIRPTTCKAMRFGPQGTQRIQEWLQLSAEPLVAIGGLRYQDVRDIKALGASGIAVISDVLHAPSPEERAHQWLTEFL